MLKDALYFSVVVGDSGGQLCSGMQCTAREGGGDVGVEVTGLDMGLDDRAD